MNDTNLTWNEVMLNSYWNNNGKYQDWADMLFELVPDEGKCPDTTPKLERFRKASNAYYNLLNNGEMSGAAKFGVSGTEILKYQNPVQFAKMETQIDNIILDAVKEAGWM